MEMWAAGVFRTGGVRLAPGGAAALAEILPSGDVHTCLNGGVYLLHVEVCEHHRLAEVIKLDRDLPAPIVRAGMLDHAGDSRRQRRAVAFRKVNAAVRLRIVGRPFV